MRRNSLVLAFALFIPLVAASAASKLEPAGALTDAAASAAVKNAVETTGHRVVLGDGSVLCEIWLRKNVPARAGKGIEGASYSDLAESEFVGVISFPRGGKDYRGQSIKAGTYALRYELLPNDGNHLGAAPTRDLLLLAPLGADQDPAAHYNFDQLMALSRQASGTNHPAVFSMLAPEGDLPRAYTSGEGYEVFAAKLKMDSGRELPFALVVKGQAEQ